MKSYVFSIPGNIGYEYIKANNLQEAEIVAKNMCQGMSWLGGTIQPLVTEVGKTYAQSR
jgi:hypothetical protein